MVGIVLQIGQQTTGINFFFSYGVQFFQSSGIDDPYVTQIILSCVNLVMTFPGMVSLLQLSVALPCFID
jgi:SP family sugar:H+ symporter-like MFS transporter